VYFSLAPAESAEMTADTWSLAITQPQRESVVAEFFTRYRYPFHWFRERHTVTRKGHIIDALQPLFPQYIFVQARDDWAPLRERTKIVGFVSFGGQLASVGDQIVTDLMLACPNDIAPQQEIACKFKRGQQLDIIAGPLLGHTAVFLRTISRDRSVLWMDIFGRNVPVSVETDCLIDHIPGPMPKRWRGQRRRHRTRNRYQARTEQVGSSPS
jgi:transcription antitermination factor NusG